MYIPACVFLTMYIQKYRCALLCVGTENGPQVLCKRKKFLTFEPSLYPLKTFL